MSSRQPQFLCLVVLVLLSSVTQALGQEKNQPYVQLLPEVMNRQLTTITGKQLKQADYHDRIIVVNLFATWAHPALLNLNDLIKLKKHYKRHRIAIIGLASDKNERSLESVREFAHIIKVNFDVVWESGDFAASLVEAVSARAVIPQTFIIDTQGRIWKHFMGYSPTNTPQLLRAALDEARRPPAPNKAATSH